ncbi:MAG: hypothetical protein HY551_00720 [Elusimicrobia bacterium]|nr:hypothetical protein [Elusimicrobiota bacterium]
MTTPRRYGPAILAALLIAAGCRSPKYAQYASRAGDFVCEVPWGWSVAADVAGGDYANITFTGPLEPDFFRGVPSLSVRWHRANTPHRLPDGTYEMYASADDFIRQMMRDVYGAQAQIWAGADRDIRQAQGEGRPLAHSQRIKVSDREATYFVVFRTLKAPEGKTYGVIRSDSGERAVLQRHGYAVVPVRGGFYALVYPATRDGFEKYRPAFFRLLNTFRLLKEGPA